MKVAITEPTVPLQLSLVFYIVTSSKPSILLKKKEPILPKKEPKLNPNPIPNANATSRVLLKYKTGGIIRRVLLK